MIMKKHSALQTTFSMSDRVRAGEITKVEI